MSQKISIQDEPNTDGQHSGKLQQARKPGCPGSFTGSLAHDFNTLLVSILGHSELALEKLPKDDPVRENIESIQKAASSAAELGDHIMFYSDDSHCEVKPTDLNKLINNMGRILSVSISKNIHVSYKLTDDIPPVEANQLQIRQVIMNLITNASEAIGENPGSITVCSGVEKPERSLLKSHGKPISGYYCYIKVTDTGCGMDHAIQEKIFDPYFTTKANGYGLGMAAVARIVESHHGIIELETSPGLGTTFTVWFPCSQQPGEALSEQTPPENALLGSGTVLVVDDEPNVLSVTQAILEHHGFDVLTAENGKQCLEVLTTGIPVDIVLLDMTMAGISAREIMRRGHQLRPNLPVVLCSGCDEHEAMKAVEGENLAGFIKKPFSLHGILTVLLKVLTSHVPVPHVPKDPPTSKLSASL